MNTRSWVSRPVNRIGGTTGVAPDKSISHRALILGAVANEPVTIDGLLLSEDCVATRRALEQLGATICDTDDGRVVLGGQGHDSLRATSDVIDLGNSGTAIRLLCGLISGLGIEATLSGDESLRTRPMERVASPLRKMGANINTHEGKPPIRIGGSRLMVGIDYLMPVASAQVKSAVLLAGIFADGTTTVRQPAPCRDHTERMLQSLGVAIEFDESGAEVVGPVTVPGGSIAVPGDFSSAAFLIVAGLLAADDGLLIRNVGLNPTRTGLLDIVRRMGGRCEVGDIRMAGAEPVGDILVHRSDLIGIDVPIEHVATAIDEFPVLFVAAAAAKGRTRVTGAEELRVKESDRIAVMAGALEKLGVRLTEFDDGIEIIGGPMGGGVIDSQGDHRIAMAMAVAGLRAKESIRIDDTANVATSFPDFVETVTGLGFDLVDEGVTI